MNGRRAGRGARQGGASDVLCPCVACEARLRLWTCMERVQVCGENLGGKGREGGIRGGATDKGRE